MNYRTSYGVTASRRVRRVGKPRSHVAVCPLLFNSIDPFSGKHQANENKMTIVSFAKITINVCWPQSMSNGSWVTLRNYVIVYPWEFMLAIFVGSYLESLAIRVQVVKVHCNT